MGIFVGSKAQAVDELERLEEFAGGGGHIRVWQRVRVAETAAGGGGQTPIRTGPLCSCCTAAGDRGGLFLVSASEPLA